MTQRELRIEIGCVEIHETDCLDEQAADLASKILTLPRQAKSDGMVVDVEFKAGRARGKLRLRDTDLPMDEIRSLQDAIRTKVLEAITTPGPEWVTDQVVDSVLADLREREAATGTETAEGTE